jgi:hypothetical protein
MRDAAFEQLDLAVAEHSAYLDYMNLEPTMDGLRGIPLRRDPAAHPPARIASGEGSRSMSPRRDAAHALTRRRFSRAALPCRRRRQVRQPRAGHAFGAPLIVDPPLADYEPILRALIGTVLPLEVPAFPSPASR